MRRPLAAPRVLRGALLIVALLTARSAGAQAGAKFDLMKLSTGPSSFPKLWNAYRPVSLPPLDFRNGPKLSQYIRDGRLSLSLKEFLQLVVENNHDVYSMRYNVLIAQVDLLRAESGQAIRGAPSAPLPASLFAGAIGAGVSNAVGLSAGGTGGAAISTQGKAVVVGARGTFDPTFSMNLSYDHVTTPLNTKIVSGLPTVVVPSTVLQTRFQQELSFGTSYSISYNIQGQHSTQAHLLFNPAISSFFAAQVYQPLLNGFGIALTRRFVTVAHNDQQIVREASRSSLTTTLSNAANAYWDYVALGENVGVAAEALRTAEDQEKIVNQKIEIGVLAPLDLVSTQSQVASARLQLVVAQTKLKQQEVLIKGLISQENDPGLDAAVLNITDRLPEPDDIEIPPLDATIAKAMENRSTVLQAELSMKNYQISESFTRKNIQPTLSVYAAFNSVGLAGSSSQAFKQFVQWAYPEYSVGFTFSVPVFNRAAQADDVRAHLETQQAEATLTQTKQAVAQQVRTATVALAQTRSQLIASERAVAASRVALNGEEERLRVGISTPYQVALMQDDLTAAEGTNIQTRVNYIKALVAQEVAAGGFLERNGIVFDDALRGNLWTDPQKP